jgi:hypothetical protein
VVEGQGGGLCGAMEGPELVTSLVGLVGYRSSQVKSRQVTSRHVYVCVCVYIVRVRVHEHEHERERERACSMYVVREP